ncbi:hypothetical protein WDU94_005852 [Cyamophila willieti]
MKCDSKRFDRYSPHDKIDSSTNDRYDLKSCDRYFSNDNTTDEDDLEDLKPVQRNAANARERARMRILSKAFYRLKTTLPWVPKDTKLSKLDTLRLATSYILHLKMLLTQDNYQKEKYPQLLNVVSPPTYFTLLSVSSSCSYLVQSEKSCLDGRVICMQKVLFCVGSL